MSYDRGRPHAASRSSPREAAALGDSIRPGTTAEREAVVRGLKHEIVIDLENGRGEVAFYGTPRCSPGKRKRRSPGTTSSLL